MTYPGYSTSRYLLGSSDSREVGGRKEREKEKERDREERERKERVKE